MTAVTLLAFALVAFIGIATGPAVLLALANGSRYGLRRAAPRSGWPVRCCRTSC